MPLTPEHAGASPVAIRIAERILALDGFAPHLGDDPTMLCASVARLIDAELGAAFDAPTISGDMLEPIGRPVIK